MVKYQVCYCPGQRRLPQVWNDELCGQFLWHIEMIELYRAPINVYWCCGLDVAARNRDFNAVRHWISTHTHVVQRLLRFYIDAELEE
jgi:hypothetical protein